VSVSPTKIASPKHGELPARVPPSGEHIPTRMPTGNRPANAESAIDGDASRLDAIAKVTGKARFSRDVMPARMLHVQAIRCPWGRARLRGHDRDAALAVPGVVEVVVDGNRGEYHGDPIGYIAAENQKALRRAMRALAPRWEREPAKTGVDPDDATLGDANDASQRALDEADGVFEATYSTPVQTHAALETHGLVVEHLGESAIVHASTQGTFAVAEQISRFLQLPASQYEVRCEYVGGGFGAKFQIGREGAYGATVAAKHKRSAFSFCDRREEHLDTGNRPSALIRVRVGWKRDGTITGGQIGVWGGVGVGRGGGGAACPSGRYDLGAIDANTTNVSYNAGAPRAMRAPGHPQGAFAEELMLDEIALAAGIDPLELRLKIDRDEGGTRRAMYRQGARLIGWDRRQPTGSQKGTIRRGFGMGSASWGALRGPARAEVVVHRDGGVEVRSGSQDIGTGFRTAIAVLAANRLGVPLEAVGTAIASSRLPNGPASGGSVTTPSLAPAVIAAALDARRQLLELAAAELGADVDELAIEDGAVVRESAAVIAWSDLCSLLPQESIVGSGEFDGRSSPHFGEGHSHGAQFVETEVDVETGVISVKRVVAIQACGRIVCRKTAESQVIGGVIQGLSFALFENRILDRVTGAMVNPNLESYKILGTDDMPVIEPIMWHDDGQTGARGLGEPPVIPTAGALAAAVLNAIGAPVRHLPMTPDKVLAAVDAAAANAHAHARHEGIRP